MNPLSINFEVLFMAAAIADCLIAICLLRVMREWNKDREEKQRLENELRALKTRVQPP